MFSELIRRIRQSFSAKIIALITLSVLVTSLVVGVATTMSTSGFLTDKAQEKFPSVLSSLQGKLRTWYVSQFGSLDRLCQPATFVRNLTRFLDGEDGPDRTAARVAVHSYLGYVHDRFPVYQELTIYSTTGEVIASTARDPEFQAVVRDLLVDAIPDAQFSPAQFVKEKDAVLQWLLVPIEPDQEFLAWMVARIDLKELRALFYEMKTTRGSDFFLLDAQGQFLTQPIRVSNSVLGQKAMQVPTRQSGTPRVEKRTSFLRQGVMHSKIHMEEQGWWLVYEEDYKEMMAPVIRAQRSIWQAVLIIGAISILLGAHIAKSILRPFCASGRRGRTCVV
ncbi:MAG: cache domain-containing protein [Candidatus Krumholzibacteriota bacterium]|nr:cache domain-containing protein [Candidatus Krumholzibacteriota bacterium]